MFMVHLLCIFNETLGVSPQDKVLQEMIKEAPGQLNFTMFLSLFSEKLSGESTGTWIRFQWKHVEWYNIC